MESKKNKKGILVYLIIIIISFMILKSMIFTVDQTEYAIITQFGNPVREIINPGLYVKIPSPVQLIWKTDKRSKIYTPKMSELLTKDKKNLLVESYVVWNVTKPLAFMKSLKNFSYAQDRLNDIVFSELGVALGKFNLDQLITTDETNDVSNAKLNDMMAQVVDSSNIKLGLYGITLKDVQLKQLNFPEKNAQSVFQRMRAEREKIARLYRSEGTEESSKIRAEAEKEKSIILSTAYEQAEKIKGKGDAEAIKIYANAFNRDPKFYEFIRSLEAYEKLIDEKTTLILPSNSKLLQYLNKIE